MKFLRRESNPQHFGCEPYMLLTRPRGHFCFLYYSHVHTCTSWKRRGYYTLSSRVSLLNTNLSAFPYIYIFLFWKWHFRPFTCFSIREHFLERGPAALALVHWENLPTPWARVSSKCNKNKMRKFSWANGEAHAPVRNRRVEKLRLAICIYHPWNFGGQLKIFQRIQNCMTGRPFFVLCTSLGLYRFP